MYTLFKAGSTMFYIGIDIAKHNHEAVILDNNGDIIEKPFSFKNTADGCNKILAAFTKHDISKDNVIIAMEATGHYWLSVYSFFVDYCFDVKVVNPIQTDAFRSLSIRKCKNDVIDSINIAKLIRFGEYSSCKVPDENVIALKNLSRYRFYLVDCCSDLKRKAIALLDQVFPEYADLFSNLFGITSRELLLKYTIPEEFLTVSTKKLTNFIEKASRGRLGKSKAEQLKSAAQNSFGITYATKSFAFQLKQIVEQIDFIENQLSEAEAEISALLKNTTAAILLSVTGIGPSICASIAGEIADIFKFDSPKKVVAYAGLDASVVQSGQFTGTQSKISKRGSPFLRRALYLAANIAAFKDPVLSKYYAKKISQGKHHCQALIAVAGKLVNIIWAVWRSGVAYTPRPQTN